MLARIRDLIYGWIMARLAPLYDPHVKPAAASEPKPYIPADEAELRTKIVGLENDVRELTAQRDTLQEANRQLAESVAELQASLSERSAKLGSHIGALIDERDSLEKERDEATKKHEFAMAERAYLDGKVREAFKHAYSAYDVLESIRTPE